MKSGWFDLSISAYIGPHRHPRGQCVGQWAALERAIG